MKPNATLILSAAFIASLTSVNAFANDGTPPWIHQLIQSDETNVTMTIGIVDSGEPGLGDSFTVEKDGPEELGTIIFEDKTFDTGQAVDTLGRCRNGWENVSYCEEAPDDCLDCDGDGVLECNTSEEGWCETVYYFDVVDQCVPEGATIYTLFETDGGWEIDHKNIQVQAWDGECEVTTGDADSDGTEGCSVTGVGASAGGGPASILTILVELVFS